MTQLNPTMYDVYENGVLIYTYNAGNPASINAPTYAVLKACGAEILLDPEISGVSFEAQLARVAPGKTFGDFDVQEARIAPLHINWM